MRWSARPPWDADELEWARECWAAGNSLREIGEAAGRSVFDVGEALDLPVAGVGHRVARDLKRTSRVFA